MIPIADESPIHKLPWVTVGLIALCCAVYFSLQPGRQTLDQLIDPGLEQTTRQELRFLVDNAAIPCEIAQGRPLTNHEFRRTFFGGDASACKPSGDRSGAHTSGKAVYLALLVSLFLHASPQHLFGNMLFLFIFGNDIETRWGWLRYLVLYLAAGIVGTLAHILTDPHSTVPIIGASGAIAGVMGAYLVCYPNTRVKTIVFFGPVLLRKIKALWLLLVWVGTQFLLVGSDSGTAWAAHVGGFLFGVLVGGWWRLHEHRGSARTTSATATQVEDLRGLSGKGSR